MASTSALAQTFRALHRSGSPLVLANVYDIISARAVAKLDSCKALATASFAVALANGTEDDDLTLEANLGAVAGIAGVAREFGKPLSVDAQDGYGDRLEEAMGGLMDLGVVGVNLEDCDKKTKKMYPIQEAAERVKTVMAVAKRKGIPDFVVNARCDIVLRGGEVSEALERGKAYLDAGATAVFVLGGKRGIRDAEVRQMVEAFGGKLSVGLRLAPGFLTVKELAEMGVSRISVGPQLQFKAMQALADEAKKLLESGA